VLIYAATQSDDFRVQRARTMQAPPDKIFALLNDFRNWRGWSPWEKLDPALQRKYSGAEAGRGAVYEWEGNKKVGQGRMEITESSPPSRVLIKLDFIKPFEGHNVTEFSFIPRGAGADVTWTMTGPRPFMMKVMGTFCNMDKMIGKDFETGLANLQALAEA
jgi:uncharacterized protein YndB with AHSA1/START domain